jgi:hypothetical protein
MISMNFRYPRGSHPENCREISTVFRIALTASCWNGALQIQRSLDDGTMGVPHLWRLRLHGGSPEFSMDPPLLDASIFRAKIPTGYSTPGNKGRCAENTSENLGNFCGEKHHTSHLRPGNTGNWHLFGTIIDYKILQTSFVWTQISPYISVNLGHVFHTSNHHQSITIGNNESL